MGALIATLVWAVLIEATSMHVAFLAAAVLFALASLPLLLSLPAAGRFLCQLRSARPLAQVRRGVRRLRAKGGTKTLLQTSSCSSSSSTSSSGSAVAAVSDAPEGHEAVDELALAQWREALHPTGTTSIKDAPKARP